MERIGPTPPPQPEAHTPPQAEDKLNVANGELAAFPLQPDGSGDKIQLARVYNEPDHRINFEGDFWSRADEPKRGQDRMVLLLTESGRQLYIRGNTVADVVDAGEGQMILRSRPVPGPGNKLPAAQIGKDYLYSEGEPIVQVCVAEDVIDLAEDPDALHVLADEWGVKAFSNPFAELNQQADQAEVDEQTKLSRLGGAALRKSKKMGITPIDEGSGIIVPETKSGVREVLLTRHYSNVLPGRLAPAPGMTPQQRREAGMVDIGSMRASDTIVETPRTAEVKKSRLSRLAGRLAVRRRTGAKARR